MVNKSDSVLKDDLLFYFSTFIISTGKGSLLIFDYSWYTWYINLTRRPSSLGNQRDPIGPWMCTLIRS